MCNAQPHKEVECPALRQKTFPHFVFRQKTPWVNLSTKNENKVLVVLAGRDLLTQCIIALVLFSEDAINVSLIFGPGQNQHPGIFTGFCTCVVSIGTGLQKWKVM